MSVVMLSYGAHLVRTGQVAGPDLLAFVIYQLTLGGILSVGTMKYLKIVELFFSVLQEISQIYTALMSAAGASQSVFDYLDRKSVQKPNGTLQPDEFQGEIEFQNVSLVYPARPDETAVEVKILYLFSLNRFYLLTYLFFPT